MITQRHVAEEAGVSQATVSIVLQGRSDASIPQETVERVLAAVERLGYRPNRYAQALRTSRTRTIACLVPDITNPFYPALVRGVQKEAEDRDYDVLVINTDGTEERERYYVEWARHGRVDGVVGAFFHLRVDDFRPLIGENIALVRIESSRKNGGELPIDDIFVDNQKAAAEIGEFLVSKGHRRIAIVAGQGGPQRVRVEGCRDALQNHGIEPLIALDASFTEDGGARAVEQLLSGPSVPTAVFAANDLMAIGAMRALRARGLEIPGDVAVVGFDDISAASLVTPGLTTVAQFQKDMGAYAAQILMDRLAGTLTGPGTTHELGYAAIMRASA
ncbi:LacI family DNA-binding transcriptional regulator [Bauldia sp.]|uniref:LacI family DNA-binding transcriptional regulator n=1 Tax=Bauldia sp. TaxID=2575872 RepID=UPI003BAB3A8A